MRFKLAIISLAFLSLVGCGYDDGYRDRARECNQERQNFEKELVGRGIGYYDLSNSTPRFQWFTSWKKPNPSQCSCQIVPKEESK